MDSKCDDMPNMHLLDTYIPTNVKQQGETIERYEKNKRSMC